MAIEVKEKIITTPAVLQMRPYQRRWIDDDARFKFMVKCARIGISFATAWRRNEIAMRIPGRTCTVLSASKAQSVEFVETCAKLLQLVGESAPYVTNEDFVDNLGRIEAIQSRITFPNGSRIIALPANPRTARGYPGDAVLDEFAHHEDSYAIFAAVFRQVALGNSLEVFSTPNGEQGKFFDIARLLGLDLGIAPDILPVLKDGWSGHWIDVFRAVAEGCPIDIDAMRRGLNDDDTWNQEFCCIFLKAVGAWLPLDLIQSCEDAGATIEWPMGYLARGPLYGGVDVGRSGDRTSFWLKERLTDVLWTRMILRLHSMPFPDQARALNLWIRLTTRTALDTTGLGIGLYDDLLDLDPVNKVRVMGVNFSGSSRLRQKDNERGKRVGSIKQDTGTDGSVRLKVDLAVRIKRAMEGRKERIPYDEQIRKELQAIKREQTATGVTFDAPRIEVDTAVAGGVRRKIYAHADDFWAHALATYAAGGGVLALDAQPAATPPSYMQLKGFL